MPTTTSMSNSNGWILLTFRNRVRSSIGALPSNIVTLRFMICFPMVVPQVDSSNAAYRKKNSPRRKSSEVKKKG